MKTSTAIIGACGEHYVASYLSGHNLIVAMPRAGIPGFDLLVSKEKSGHAMRIQVKTGTQAFKYDKEVGNNIYLWSTSYSVIERDDKFLWYAYVWLRGWPSKEEQPEIFFVPAKKVVECMKSCKEDGDTWPYFWLNEEEADIYKGANGLKNLMDFLEA